MQHSAITVEGTDTGRSIDLTVEGMDTERSTDRIQKLSWTDAHRPETTVFVQAGRMRRDGVTREVEDLMDKNEHSSAAKNASGEARRSGPGSEQEAAKERLMELEDRLRRLEQMRSKISGMMKGSASRRESESLQTQHGKADRIRWSLPGVTEPTRQAGHQHHDHSVSAKLGARYASGEAEWSRLEDLDGDVSMCQGVDGEEDGTSRDDTNLPAYLKAPPNGMVPAPPFTPGLSGLRKVIREEVSTVVAEALNYDGSKRKSTSPSAVIQEEVSTVVVEALKGKKSDVVSPANSSPSINSPSHTDRQGRPRTSSKRAWIAHACDAESPGGDEDDDDDQEARQQEKSGPACTIEDAEERSLSLFFGGFSRQSQVRQTCFNMMNSKVWGAFFFSNAVLSCFASAVVMELGMRNDPEYLVVEYVFTAIFLTEVVVGIVSLGFINGPTSWLRTNGLNVSTPLYHLNAPCTFHNVIAKRRRS